VKKERKPSSLPADVELRRIHLSSYEEIYNKIYKRIGKLIEKNKTLEKKDNIGEALEILNTTYNIVLQKLEPYNKLYKLIMEKNELRAYISLVLGEQALEVLERVARLEGKVRQLYISLKGELLSSDRRDLRKKALGMSSRLLSILKRNRKLLEEALEIKKEAMLFPDLTEKISIIIAGPPNSGKSTLASKISNAKTEIADYPFTTKRAIPGRLTAESLLDIAVLDTPGILPKSLSEMSLPERRAMASLRMARGILLFLLDPTSYATVGLDQQLRMLSDLRKEVTELIIAVNKIDLVNDEELASLRQALSNIVEPKDVYFISAAENIGVEDLVESLRKKARELILTKGGGEIGDR
jgi:nucleolar GTP-binding protein